MAKSNTNSKKGFTIIEVVLVLAIAGLIFLMVFIALPSMQRGQRDTQRRNDMSRFISQLSSYQANNSGRLPHTNSKNDGKTDGGYNDFVEKYLKVGGDTFSDPSTKDDYKVTYKGAAGADNDQPGEDDLGEVYLYSAATCEGEDVVQAVGNNRIAITMKLEGAGYYCGHN